MLVLELLKWAAADSPWEPRDRILARLDEGHAGEVQWVLDAGLGPMLYRATREHFDYVPSALRDVLLSSDLTAQVRHACVIDTANEVIDICRELGTPVTLLKGISISDQYYPAAHLRPMGDIDVLVPADACDSVESAILRRGYSRKPDHDPSENTRHGVPLFQPRHGVWVEVHTALFERVRPHAVFSSSHIGAQSVASTFHGRPVNRLTDELQLLYIASSWIADLSRYGTKIHPSCLPALLDAIFLLKARAPALDCDAFFGWPENEMAIASLYVTLSYLSRCGLNSCAHSIASRLASSQDIVGALQLRIIHAMLDHYLIGGRPWNHLLPLPVPGRYSMRHQVRKRWPFRRHQ